MIPRIKDIQPLDDFILLVEFDDGKKVNLPSDTILEYGQPL